MPSGAAMTVNDVAELLFAARERIDFYWNFHAVVVIAVLGWLVSLERTLGTSRKALVSVVYLIAVAMNLAGLHSAYTLAEALRTDLLRVAADSPLTDTRLLLEQHSYLAHRLAAYWIHLAVGASVLGVVWFARLPGSTSASAERPDRRLGEA
jgi:hypothetical protein